MNKPSLLRGTSLKLGVLGKRYSIKFSLNAGLLLFSLLFFFFFSGAELDRPEKPSFSRRGLNSHLLLSLASPQGVNKMSEKDSLFGVINPQDFALRQLSEVSYIKMTVIHEASGDRVVINEIRRQVPRAVYPQRPQSRVPDFTGNVFYLDWFPLGNMNNLHGYYAPFFRAPGWAAVKLEGRPDEADGVYLDFIFRLKSPSAAKGVPPAPSPSSSPSSPGYAGFWIHFFNYKLPPTQRIYLDASPFNYLRFLVRGEVRGARLKISLADADWERREDALPLGYLDEFLPQKRITPVWQEVWVPIKTVRLNFKALASLVFLAEGDAEGRAKDGEVNQANVRGEGESNEAAQIDGRLAIKDIALAVESKPLLPRKKIPPQIVSPSPGKKAKATWAWHDRVVTWLRHEEQLNEDVAFLKAQGFTDIFLQVPYFYRTRAGTWALTWPPEFYPGLQLAGEDPLLRPYRSRRFPEWELSWPAEQLPRLLEKLHQAGLAVKALIGRPEYALSRWHGLNLALLEAILTYNQQHPPAQRFQGIHYDIEPYLIPGFFSERQTTIMKEYLDFLRRTRALIQEAAPSGDFVLGVDIPFWYDSRDKYFRPVAKLDERSFDQAIIDLADEVVVMDYRTMAYGADGLIEHIKNELAYADQQGKRVYLGVETGALPDETIYEFTREGRGPSALLVKEKAGRWHYSWHRRFSPSQGQLGQGGGWVGWEISREEVPAAKITFHDYPRAIFSQEINQALVRLNSFRSLVGVAIHSFSSYKEYISRQERQK